MRRFTVFTTTYNRKTLLRRLYESLTRQTSKDFVWLIVDDGSTDGTDDLVNSLKCEGLVDIDYHHKKNGGKHTAMKMGFELTSTKYMVEIDDDDELMADAIEIFSAEWNKIEYAGKTDIAEIRALSISDAGKISGNYNPQTDIGFTDSDYFEMEWLRNKHFENVTCWNMELIRRLDIFCDEGKWLYDKVKLISEAVFWNRVAKKYKTRYLFRPLRLYHADSGDSITLASFSRQKCYNYVFSLSILVNEMGKDGWKNPKHLVKYLAEYMACGLALDLNLGSLLRNLNNSLQRFICLLLYMPAKIVAWRFKKSF